MQQLSLWDLEEDVFDIKIIDTLRSDPMQMKLKKAIVIFYENDSEKDKESIEAMRAYLEKYKDVFRDYDKFVKIINDLEKLI